MRPIRRTVRLAAVLAGILLLCGCLEPPISETLTIRMLPGGASIVSVEVALRDPADYREKPKVKERIENEMRAIDERRDGWSRRLEAAGPERQRDVTSRKAGRLDHVVRTARLASVDDLRALLRDGGVAVSYTDGEGWAELTLTPPKGGGRAPTAVRERVGRELGVLANRLSTYIESTGALYAYLDRKPGRARACLGKVLDDAAAKGELDAEETRLTSAVEDAIDQLGALLDVPEGEAETLDELSRSVFDPFPAPIMLGVSGTIVEREGFPGEPGEPLRIPTFSLWHAFERLEGRWQKPDPALAIWRADLAHKDVDVAGFTALPRRATERVSAGEIRKAIEVELMPAPVYRVKWRPTLADPDDDPLTP